MNGRFGVFTDINGGVGGFVGGGVVCVHNGALLEELLHTGGRDVS